MSKCLYGSRKKLHYLYKTTNTINGKVYYGMHSTDNLEDGYIGSGTYLRRSIKKYGKDKFKLTILKYFDSREALVEAEKRLISLEKVKDANCYNLKLGGNGGSSRDFMLSRNKKSVERIRWLWENDKEWADRERRRRSLFIKEKWKRGEYNHLNHATYLGKRHSAETKLKMSASSKGKGLGELNSQFGTCWITNGKINKKIKKGTKLPIGWQFGRKFKH